MKEHDMLAVAAALKIIEDVIASQSRPLSDYTLDEFADGLRFYSRNGLEKLRLYPHQKNLIECYNSNDVVMVANSRQVGISLFNIIYSLFYAMKNNGSRIGIVSSNLTMSNHMIEEAIRIFEINFERPLPTLNGDEGINLEATKPRVKRRGMFVLPNGSTIMSITGKPDSGTKRKIADMDITIIENLSFMSHVDGNKLVDIALRESNKVFLCSSVTEFPNAFNEKWFALNNYAKIAITATEVMKPYRDADFFDNLLGNLGEERYNSEINNTIKFKTIYEK